MSSDSLAGDHSSGEVSPYVGAMLGVAWQWVRDQMYAGVVAAGYDDLNAAHVGLWRYPGLDGLRPSQLADQRESRNSRSTTCSGTWKDTGTWCANPIRPTEGLA